MVGSKYSLWEITGTSAASRPPRPVRSLLAGGCLGLDRQAAVNLKRSSRGLLDTFLGRAEPNRVSALEGRPCGPFDCRRPERTPTGV